MFSMIRVWLGSPSATVLIAAVGAVMLLQRQWPAGEARQSAAPRQNAPPPSNPPPAELLRALNHPGPGEMVDSWTITAVRGGEQGVLELDVRKGDTELTVSVVPRGAWDHSPPISAGSYDLFYGTPREGSPAPGEIMQLLEALSRRIDPGEGKTGGEPRDE